MTTETFALTLVAIIAAAFLFCWFVIKKESDNLLYTKIMEEHDLRRRKLVHDYSMKKLEFEKIETITKTFSNSMDVVIESKNGQIRISCSNRPEYAPLPPQMIHPTIIPPQQLLDGSHISSPYTISGRPDKIFVDGDCRIEVTEVKEGK
jgi:hypothetical protein